MTQEVSVDERSVPLRTEKRLAEDSFLTDDFLRQLINVGEVDILVGSSTHNNAKSVGPIVQSIQTGSPRDVPSTRAPRHAELRCEPFCLRRRCYARRLVC